MKEKSKMERTLANERVHQKKNSATGIKWEEVSKLEEKGGKQKTGKNQGKEYKNNFNNTKSTKIMNKRKKV